MGTVIQDWSAKMGAIIQEWSTNDKGEIVVKFTRPNGTQWTVRAENPEAMREYMTAFEEFRRQKQQRQQKEKTR